MEQSDSGLIINGFIEVAAEDRDRAIAVLRESMAKTRGKDGCNFYVFGADVANPNRFLMSEGWRDQGAINAHLQSPDFQETMRQAGMLKVVARSVQLYAVSGKVELELPDQG